MRVDRLDLTAFGPFTNRSLDLSAAGVHVVHGPNEAGKSSALAALRALLYGIPHRTTHDFVHAKRDLRLGARLDDGAGTVLEIVRHKRNKNALTDDTGAPLSEDTLSRLLNGVSEEVFASTFALTLDELKTGGEALLRGEGDLGRALYSAQSSQDLSAVLAELEKGQRDLYLHSGSKPRLNQGLRRHGELTRALRETATDTDTYVRLRRERDQATARFTTVDAEHRKRQADYDRWERLRLALPLLRTRDAAMTELGHLHAAGPIAPPDADQRRQELDRALEKSWDDRERAAGILAEARAALERVEVDPALTAVRDTVESLVQAAAGTAKAESALEDLEHDGEEHRVEAARLLRDLQREADTPDALRIDPAARERITLIAGEHADVSAGVRGADHQVTQARRGVDKAEADLAALPAVLDTEVLSSVLASVPSDLPDTLSREHDALAATVARFDSVLGAAGWADHTPADLLAAPVPTRSEVTTHRERANEHRGELKSQHREHRKLTADRGAAQAELDELLARSNPPSPEELSRAREERDALWQRIHTAATPDPDTHTAFATALAQADELADRLLREADGVARRGTLERRIHTLDQDIGALDDELAGLAQAGAQLERTWAALWPSAAIPAPALEAAEDRLDQVRELRDLHEKRQEQERAFSWTQDVARGLTRQLRALLDEAGTPTETLDAETDGPGALTVLLRQLTTLAQEELARRTEAAEAHAEAERRVATATEALEQAQEARTDAEAALAAWTRRWNEAIAPAGFPPDTPPEAVRTDLDRLAEAADRLDRATEAERRAAAERAEITRFDDELRAVFARCGMDLPEDRAERSLALTGLSQRVKDNAEQDRRRADLTTQIAEADTQLTNAETAEKRARQRLADLCTEVGVSDTEELRAAITRAERVERERTRRANAEEQLAQFGDLDTLAEQVRGLGEDEIGERVTAAKSALDSMATERDAAQTAMSEARFAFDQVDGSAKAARVAEELASLESDLMEQAEQYLRLTLARDLLHQQIETYRRENQDPILDRAAEIFHALTLGRFTELCPDTDDKGGNVLRVRRETGGVEDVPSLSEGTRDQLYLALRLASLERYADAGQTMPFVVDDVFMTFDDARSTAALHVLDSLADRFQLVVFTHHDHLVTLAENALPPGRTHPHTLTRFTPPQRTTAP